MLIQNFAVVISKYYASRCLTLIESILKYDVKIYVLCFDKKTLQIINKSINSKKVTAIHFNKVLNFDRSLKVAIKDRKLIDKIVTSRPIFLKLLFKKFKLRDIFLLDSDIFFFSNPVKINKYIKGAAVAFCKHNFSRNNNKLSKKYGKYNGGFIYVKSNINGFDFLNKWSLLCKKWCQFDSINGKFSDQKYLEDLSTSVKNVKILNKPEINLAPWNLEGKIIKFNEENITVNKKKLIFFHFHGLRQISKRFFILGIENYDFTITNKIKKILFYEYVKSLSEKSITREYFWTKNNLFSKLLKVNLLFKKITKNDYLILTK